MTTEKFKKEVETLKKFFTINCKDNHKDQKSFTKTLVYNNEEVKVELDLCDECASLIDYAFERLINCPFSDKPKCRTCPSPCYEKKKWKLMAKIMKYSGLKLGLIRIRKMILGIRDFGK